MESHCPLRPAPWRSSGMPSLFAKFIRSGPEPHLATYRGRQKFVASLCSGVVTVSVSAYADDISLFVRDEEASVLYLACSGNAPRHQVHCLTYTSRCSLVWIYCSTTASPNPRKHRGAGSRGVVYTSGDIVHNVASRNCLHGESRNRSREYL